MYTLFHLFFVVVSLVLAALLAFFWNFLLLLVRQHRSPLRYLHGPPSHSFFMGNLGEMHDQENTNLIGRWEAEYGSTFVYRGFVGGCRLMTTDPVAVAHILGNAYDYPKPDFVRTSLAEMAAGHEGLVTVEGEVHRKQRKILTPAFSSTHIKSLTPIFWSKATQLRDILFSEIDTTQGLGIDENDSLEEGRTRTITRIDALMLLGRATLDVIGLAGFGYAFNSLTEDSNELASAFSVIFSTARKFRVMTILQVWFPFLRRFRRNNASMHHAQTTMRRIGLELIEEKKREIELEELENKKEKRADNEKIEGDKSGLGRDLLSVLIRSNMSSSPHQRMSVNEVLCQISTFLAAGHETTASALTWCLYALARDQTAQDKLRAALKEVEIGAGGSIFPGDVVSDPESISAQKDLTERITRCEYLDWVIRETLRIHAPVTSTMRVCMRDQDEIPVQDGGFTDKSGRRRCGIPVNKWDIISIPIQAINKSEALWGDDAQQFRPDRWASPQLDARAIPGLYANTLTFLNGNPLVGNRACIGYKFALIEMKIFLYVLVKDIYFSMDPLMVIEKKVNVVTRPFVKSEPEAGNQMPLLISRTFGSTTFRTASDECTHSIPQ